MLPNRCDQKTPHRVHRQRIKRNAVNMEQGTEKYLLSGASGMLGTAIRREMAARRMEMLFLARTARNTKSAPASPRPSAQAGKPAASTSAFRTVALSISGEIPWDPASAPAIQHPELLEGVTAAIHLSGVNVSAHRWTPAYKKEIASSRIDSTRTLSTALANLRHPPATLLVASATGIYGNRGDEMLDESSAPGSGFLADLCRQWEAAAQPAIDAGIRVVHLRFGVVLGPRTTPGALAKLVPLFRLGLGGRLGAGTQWMSWISLPDVVSAVLFLLENPAISGPVNLTAPNPVTNAQFTRILARQLHRPASLPAPVPLLRLALGEIADEALLSSARAFPSRLSGAGFHFEHPTLDLALGAALAKR
jgi:uncharacterized protein (TIGR01777 family)